MVHPLSSLSWQSGPSLGSSSEEFVDLDTYRLGSGDQTPTSCSPPPHVTPCPPLIMRRSWWYEWQWGDLSATGKLISAPDSAPDMDVDLTSTILYTN